MKHMTMQEHYDLITAGVPRIYGAEFNPDEENHELLITCKCDEKYLVRLNAEDIIEDNGSVTPQERVAFAQDESLYCPHCKLSAAECRIVATHSGQVFDLTVTYS